MEKKIVLFIVLSVGIIVGTSYFFPAPKKNPPVKVVPMVSPEKPANPEKGVLPPPQEPAFTGSPGSEEKRIRVNTPLYQATLSNRGAVIRQWELKTYQEKDGKTEIKLLKDETGLYPLSVEVKDDNSYFIKGVYALEGEDLFLDETKKAGTLTFLLKDPASGRSVQKKLTFHSDSYTVDIELQTENIPYYEFLLGSNFGIHEWGDKNSIGFVGPISLIDNKVVKENPAKIHQDIIYEGKSAWTAIQDKYFLSALIPKNEGLKTIVKSLKENEVTVGAVVAPGKAAISQESFVLYAGPKKLSDLSSLHIFLEETVDFGWFIAGSWSLVRLISQPLFSILPSLRCYTHNYGVAIIILTVLIKALFIPLTHKSYKSMKGMQAIQPLMAELQKKYKNDKQRLNREIMELYKAHKVNPVGGCLPMILQIPVFVALFNIFNTTIELRQAPFMFWITDLSDFDPLYVLPVIMGITMFIQQKIQPSNLDPTQAKIMLFLPVIFTFFFLKFSSGLVLYWMVNNILSIAQQFITARYFANGGKTLSRAGKKG